MSNAFPASFLTVLSSFLLLMGGCASPHMYRGTLTGELHWQGEVRLRGDVLLPEGTRLRIAPGTQVVFLPPLAGEDSLTDHPHFPGSELIVRGEILAEGTPEEPILFRYIDETRPAGSWGGINLQQSRRAVFRFCRFSGADSALHSQESKVLVEECLFEGNDVALRFHTSDIIIRQNTLRNNGTGIRFHFGAPRIHGNDIRGNRRAFFITSHPSDFVIEGNNIVDSGEFHVVLGEEVPEDIPMPANWWGTSFLPELSECFFDKGRGSYLGRVLVDPLAVESFPDAGASWSR